MELTTDRANGSHVENGPGFIDFSSLGEDTRDPNGSNAVYISSGPVFDLYEQAALAINIYPLVILLVFIVIGMIGNTFVMYIFTFKWERNKTSVFIITLAVLDIANCSINMPIEVSVLFKPFSFDYHLFCKAARCFSYIITAAYSFVLVAVAYDRYLMICRPLKRMTLGKRYATRTCIGAVLIAVVSQFPSFFLYGTFVFEYPVNIPLTNLTITNTTHPLPELFVQGKTCLVTNYYYYVNRTPTFLFQGFLFIGHVIIFVTLTVVYIIIGRRLYISSHIDIVDSGSQQGLLKRSIMSALTGTSGLGTKTSITNSEDEQSGVIANKKINKLRSVTDHIRNGSVRSDTVAFSPQSPSKFRSLHNLPTCSDNGRRFSNTTHEHDKLTTAFLLHPVNGSQMGQTQNHFYNAEPTDGTRPPLTHITRSVSLDIGRLYSIGNGNHSLKPSTDIKEMSLRRNTLIMRMVTFTFMLSYLPFLILVTLRYSDPDVPTKLNKTSKIVYHVFLRSYFLNSVIRPFIYIVMNQRYRSKVCDLVKHCFRK